MNTNRKDFIKKIKTIIKKLDKREIILLGILLFILLMILHVYSSLDNNFRELKRDFIALRDTVKISSDFNSLTYINYVEPIFIQTAEEVNLKLSEFFKEGGVQITEKRYEEIKEIVTISKTKIQKIAPLSVQTQEIKKRILDFYDKYLLNLSEFIGLTKEELARIREAKGPVYQKMQDLEQERKDIEGAFNLLKKY